MKEQLEKDIQRSILDFLNIHKVFCWKQNNSGISTGNADNRRWIPSGLQGVSDILGILSDGRFLALEVKRKSGRLSDKQDEFIKKILSNNGVAGVVTSIDDVQLLFKKYNVKYGNRN